MEPIQKWMRTKVRRLMSLAATLGILLALIAAISVTASTPAFADVTPVLQGTDWFGGSGANVCSNDNGGGTDPTCGGQTHVGSSAKYGYWQCVELAQRFYQQQGWHSGTFPGVSVAADIYSSASAMGMSTQANGSITSIVPGDMIIHGLKDKYSVGAGHVAIVDHISGTNVYAIQQNAPQTASYVLNSSGTLTGGSGNDILGIVHSPKNTNTGGSGGGSSGSSGRTNSSDVDGNGGSDLVLTTSQPSGGSAAQPLLSTYQSFMAQSKWWVDSTVGWSGITPLVGDVNGDHKADYVFIANNPGVGVNVYVALSTGSGFGVPQLWWNGTGFGYGGIKASLADVDGNGGADLILTTSQPSGGSAALVLLSTFQSFWYQGAWWSDPNTGWAGITPLVGDVNGDGKADFIFLANNNGVGTNAYVALSTGSGFGIPQLWWNGTGYGYSGIKAALGDVDNNGGVDLVLVTNQPSGGSAAIVLLSTYQGFMYDGIWWSDPNTGWAGITPLVGDLNGDHKADFVFLADNNGVGTNAYVALSTGSGFQVPTLWWNGTGYGYSGIKAPLS